MDDAQIKHEYLNTKKRSAPSANDFGRKLKSAAIQYFVVLAFGIAVVTGLMWASADGIKNVPSTLIIASEVLTFLAAGATAVWAHRTLREAKKYTAELAQYQAVVELSKTLSFVKLEEKKLKQIREQLGMTTSDPADKLQNWAEEIHISAQDQARTDGQRVSPMLGDTTRISKLDQGVTSATFSSALG